RELAVRRTGAARSDRHGGVHLQWRAGRIRSGGCRTGVVRRYVGRRMAYGRWWRRLVLGLRPSRECRVGARRGVTAVRVVGAAILMTNETTARRIMRFDVPDRAQLERLIDAAPA